MSKKPSKKYSKGVSNAVKLNRYLNKLEGNKRSRKTYQSLAAPVIDKITSINVFNKLLGRKRGTRNWSPTMETREARGSKKSTRRKRKINKRKSRKQRITKRTRRTRRSKRNR